MGGEYVPEKTEKPKREKKILDNITVVGKLNMNENKASKAINIAIASSRLMNTSLKSIEESKVHCLGDIPENESQINKYFYDGGVDHMSTPIIQE
jgi:hypothetical protein